MIVLSKHKEKRINIAKKELKNMYLKDLLTTYEIAKIRGCCPATIRNKLVKFGINRRKAMKRKAMIPSIKDLEKWYVDEKLSTWKIEKKYGYCRGTLHRYLKKYGLNR